MFALNYLRQFFGNGYQFDGLEVVTPGPSQPPNFPPNVVVVADLSLDSLYFYRPGQLQMYICPKFREDPNSAWVVQLLDGCRVIASCDFSNFCWNGRRMSLDRLEELISNL